MDKMLTIYDYLIFAAVLLISAGIGLYFRFTGGKQSTVREYLLADKQMGFLPVSFSLMASFMSAVTLLGVSSENYIYGTLFQVINISYAIATPIAAYLFLPVFYNLNVTSVYEYLEKRFGKPTRLIASAAFSLQMILYMGIVLYAPALALSAVTGLNKIFAIVSIGLVCTFYSTIGGMKAVLITDMFQSILMFIASFCVVFHGIFKMGLAEIWKRADDGGRIEFFEFSPSPTIRHSVWSQVIGGTFIYLSLYAVNQAQVQRLLSCRTLKQSQKSLWIQLPILMFLSFGTALAGLTIYARYYKCDPLKNGQICANDQLLPFYVKDNMSHLSGISGLFIGGILSGSLSTVSSCINSLAAVTWSDYIQTFFDTSNVSQFKVMFINKGLAIMYGILCIGLAFVAEKFTGVLQASLTIFGVVGGPLLGLFTLGMMVPFVGQKSASIRDHFIIFCSFFLISFLVALGFGLWIGFGGPKPPTHKLPTDISECPFSLDNNTCPKSSPSIPRDDSEYFYLYRISYMWYTLIGFSVTVILGVLLSYLFNEPTDVQSDLLSPIINKYRKRTRHESNKNISIDKKNDNIEILQEQDGDNQSQESIKLENSHLTKKTKHEAAEYEEI